MNESKLHCKRQDIEAFLARRKAGPKWTKRFFALWPLSLLHGRVEKCQKEREHYAHKLEASTDDKIFKYLLLINISFCEEYIAQTRIQAEKSFQWSIRAAGAGFILIMLSIFVALYQKMYISDGSTLELTYLTGIAGLLSQFIAAVFLFMYNKTLNQFDQFHEDLQLAQRLGIGLLVNSMTSNETQRDTGNLELAKLLFAYQKKNTLP